MILPRRLRFYRYTKSNSGLCSIAISSTGSGVDRCKSWSGTKGRIWSTSSYRPNLGSLSGSKSFVVSEYCYYGSKRNN